MPDLNKSCAQMTHYYVFTRPRAETDISQLLFGGGSERLCRYRRAVLPEKPAYESKPHEALTRWQAEKRA